jgi:hypothetical protein
VVGGLILLGSRSRVFATFGGWLAVAAGGWYVVGPLLSPLWDSTFLGQPIGDKTDQSVEQIGLFFGLGAVIVLFAAFALGRLAVIGARDVEMGEREAARRDAVESEAAQGDVPEREHSSFIPGRRRHSHTAGDRHGSEPPIDAHPV